MHIALLSDIHGNLPALEAVMETAESRGVSRYYCLGDIVGYGPFPVECLELVRKVCTAVIRGNHDSGLVGDTPIEDFNQHGKTAINWTRTVILPEHEEYIRTLPHSVVADGLTLAHASPHNPESWMYVLTLPAAIDAFSAFTTPLCFIGHTHVPVIVGEDGVINNYRNGTRHLINVGSVGQPRDGNPNAAFGIYDSETASYELVRVAYDIRRTADAIAANGLPDFLARRLFQGI